MRIDEAGFSNLIKQELKRNIFFIYGDDDYLKNFYCNRLVKVCVPEEMQVFNLHIYNDDETAFEEIFETADCYPMMCDKTVLLVRNYKLSTLKKDNLDKFIEKLRAVPETTVIIFFYDTMEVDYGPKWKPGAWNEVIDKIDTVGVIAEINSRSEGSLANLLVKKAPDRGTTIGQEEAIYLVSTVGTDMQNLLNEFNKVCSYSGGKPVTKAMIDNVCVKSVEADVFMICNSIFAKKNDTAYAVMNELLRLGVTAQEILGAMNSTFVNMYRIKVALNANRVFEDVVNIFSMNKGQASAARRLITVVKPMRLSSIRKCIGYLSDADVKIKRMTGIDDKTVLTELIALLCGVLDNA